MYNFFLTKDLNCLGVMQLGADLCPNIVSVPAGPTIDAADSITLEAINHSQGILWNNQSDRGLGKVIRDQLIQLEWPSDPNSFIELDLKIMNRLRELRSPSGGKVHLLWAVEPVFSATVH